jgi:restriction system protein
VDAPASSGRATPSSAQEATQKVTERERKRQDAETGKADAEQRTAALAARVAVLESVLVSGLDRNPRMDLLAMRRRDELPPLDLGTLGEQVPLPLWRNFEPPALGVVSGLFGGKARHEQQIAQARREFERAQHEHRQAEAAREQQVQEVRAHHDGKVREHQAQAAERNARLTAIAAGVGERDRESVQGYLELVLARVPLPEGFPNQVEVAYSPRGEQAVVRFELPPVDIVPTTLSYTYVSTLPELREKPRPPAQVAQLYRLVVSQVALLHMRDLFEADAELDNVELGGHVHSINPATGQREYPCLISVAVDRDAYVSLNLRDVRPDVCLRHLNAVVSHHPDQVEAITPVRNFDLARYSFVEGVDVVAGLDSRTDLTKMTADEFEHFVRQVFEAMGMEGWTTQRSGDDGVDAVVINPNPYVGGLTIVQAKKYNRVLGVNHIRELVGAMDEKRAGRAILVTTSWFASGGWTKATENGRVELIDGPRLRHLVQEHLKKDVLIAAPTSRRRR